MEEWCERRESVSEVVEGAKCVRRVMREAMAARGMVRVGEVERRVVYVAWMLGGKGKS